MRSLNMIIGILIGRFSGVRILMTCRYPGCANNASIRALFIKHELSKSVKNASRLVY